MPKELLGICRLIRNGDVLAIKLSVALLNDHQKLKSNDGEEYLIIEIRPHGIYDFFNSRNPEKLVTIGGINNGNKG